jgi:hypothetical protein
MLLSILLALVGVLGDANRTPSVAPRAECVRGQYVEARTASVFAGACHYGSEYTTSGREALLAWHFESGVWRGVELAGTDVVLAVADDVNLAADGTKRHAIVYTDARSSRERNDAAVDLVLTRCRELAGNARRVVLERIDLSVGGEQYALRAPGAFELLGSKLANRECCKMPYDVWYAPFVALIDPVVGCNSTFEYADKSLGPVWKRAGQNESFVGRFEWSGAPHAATAVDVSRSPELRAATAAERSAR